MKPKKIVYYDDALNDEFSGTKIKRKPLPDNYKYVNRNIFYRAFAWFFYYLIALPILFFVMKFIFHYKVKGNKRIRGIMNCSCFFYGNHTSFTDALIAQALVSRGKRTYIVTNQDTTSIKGIRWLVTLLGCIPTPETPAQRNQFVSAIKYRVKQHCGIAIFPEAHIWPYSTHIRPFSDASFVYPSELGSPVVAMCTTYRQRKIFKNKPPLPTVHVSKPYFPNMQLSLPERKAELRQKVYDFLLDCASSEENVEYIAYVKRKKEEPK